MASVKTALIESVSMSPGPRLQNVVVNVIVAMSLPGRGVPIR